LAAFLRRSLPTVGLNDKREMVFPPPLLPPLPPLPLATVIIVTDSTADWQYGHFFVLAGNSSPLRVEKHDAHLHRAKFLFPIQGLYKEFTSEGSLERVALVCHLARNAAHQWHTWWLHRNASVANQGMED
jgi:hypothetical protein